MNTLQFTAKAIVSALLIGGASIISSCSGDDGADGVTPECKEGTWHNGNKDTGVSCVGQSGQSVPPTCVGGTWHNGSTDTGVSCVGQDGQSGTGTAPTCVDGTWHNGAIDTEIPCAAVAENCVIENDEGYYVMKCGGVESARWAKAMCGRTAYDPEKAICEADGSLSFFITHDGEEYKYAKIGELDWMIEDLKGTFNWTEAMEACPADWRLPSKDETEEVGNEIINYLTNDFDYWTSDEENDDKSYAFAKLTSGLDMASYAKGSLKHVRCVME